MPLPILNVSILKPLRGASWRTAYLVHWTEINLILQGMFLEEPAMELNRLQVDIRHRNILRITVGVVRFSIFCTA